jgi:Carboxypeptidase regulatory-like domain/Putative zinc-finger
VNWNFQLGVHPDPDQLSVFVEGAATSREHERMLAHLAECAECRKAVFFMQPHEETQLPARTPVKEWTWGRLLPVWLPAAALACGLVAVLLYMRPHGGTPQIPQQNASVRQPDIQLPQTTVAPMTDSDRVARSESSKYSSGRNALSSNLSRQENQFSAGSNLPQKSQQRGANVGAPQTMAAAPPASVPVDDARKGTGGGVGGAAYGLPLNGWSITDLQQLSTPTDTKAAPSQDNLAKKEELGGLTIEQESGHDKMLAEVSGRITDPTGATISGATISLRDASGQTRQTTTSPDGNFRLTELPAGQYELTATARGFRTTKQSIRLNPSQFAMLQPVLDVGAVSETVEVASGPVEIQTESANVGQAVAGQATAKMPSTARDAAILSGLPVAATVQHGKQVLSLDSTGNLLLSRNGGKKWKKISPQWTGKAVRIELNPAYSSEAPPKAKNETLEKPSEAAVFLLTTDTGTIWTSKDGAHWHRQ